MIVVMIVVVVVGVVGGVGARRMKMMVRLQWIFVCYCPCNSTVNSQTVRSVTLLPIPSNLEPTIRVRQCPGVSECELIASMILVLALRPANRPRAVVLK